MEVVLKLTKKGALESAKILIGYLPQKMMDTLNSLANIDTRMGN